MQSARAVLLALTLLLTISLKKWQCDAHYMCHANTLSAWGG